MEAVPRMPMLSFELKQCPEYVDFGPVLKQYIKNHYGEDPAHYNKACSDLEQLRQSAVHVSHDFMGCSTLKKYYAQLQFLQGRFPMGEEGECGINFTWEDVFLGREVTIPDVKFEQACILYNIGALHSILGSIETRQSADGMKVSCTHFQCAAWAFEYLRDHFGSSNLSVDMSHEVLTFQVHLMLAQAQECILEKSMIDSRKNTITAKVSAQVVEFYRTVIKSLQTENMDAILGSRKYKDWKKRAELKILFYEVITNYYMGRNSEEQEKFGECVAYYTLSYDKLKDAIKMAKSESSDIQESLRFTNDVVGGKFQSAKKDNDYVYHEKIPAGDTLPEVKGASLVKGIPFNWNDPEVSGPDIFQKLVPMSAHEASSMYSEEKAKLMRTVGAEIEGKNMALLQFMSSLNLDPSKLNFEPERLPQDLLEKCAAVSVRPNAIKDLVDAMGAVSNTATDVELAIQEINDLIENDVKEDEEFQKQFGKRSQNPMLPEIKKDSDRFQEGHKKGNQSNVDLHKAMNTHITNLKLLAGPLEDIKNHLPSLERDRDPESESVVKELQRLLDKVEEMKNQRAMLEEQFRKQVKEDDITNQIVAQDGGSNTMVMFEEQLKKHDKQIGYIHQNLDAQDNILRALTDVNARYATTRRATADTITRREATIEGLKNSYDVYEDLLAKSQKGLEFYKKLETNINRLLERCRGICKQQSEERQQVIDRLKPKEPSVRPVTQKPADASSMLQGPGSALPYGPSNFSNSPGGVMPGSPSGPIGPMPDLHASLPGFEGPKLKDYLPFMKPKTFGKGRVATGSLPSSLISSPVHLPPGPDSLPASPLHGMSDEDIRKLGITDPKVLAMIRAHSLPPVTGSSQQPSGVGGYQQTPGAGGYQQPHGNGGYQQPPGGQGYQHPSAGETGQAVNYPSPSQSPSLQGGMTGTVRFDRSTKPSGYTQNLGPQGMPQSQQRMVQPNVPQSAAGYNMGQPQSGMPPGMPQMQGGFGPNASYPLTNNLPQMPANTSVGHQTPGSNQSFSSQGAPSQSNYQQAQGQAVSNQGYTMGNMGQVQTGQHVPQTNVVSSTGQQDPTSGAPPPGAQYVPSRHPAQSGMAPPGYGNALQDRMNQIPSSAQQNYMAQTSTTTYNQPSVQRSSQGEVHSTRGISPNPQNLSEQSKYTPQQTMNSQPSQSQGQMYQQGQMGEGQNQQSQNYQGSFSPQSQGQLPHQQSQQQWLPTAVPGTNQYTQSGQQPPIQQAQDQRVQQPIASQPQTPGQPSGQRFQQPNVGQQQTFQTPQRFPQANISQEQQGQRFQQPNVSQQQTQYYGQQPGNQQGQGGPQSSVQYPSNQGQNIRVTSQTPSPQTQVQQPNVSQHQNQYYGQQPYNQQGQGGPQSSVQYPPNQGQNTHLTSQNSSQPRPIQQPNVSQQQPQYYGQQPGNQQGQGGPQHSAQYPQNQGQNTQLTSQTTHQQSKISSSQPSQFSQEQRNPQQFGQQPPNQQQSTPQQFRQQALQQPYNGYGGQHQSSQQTSTSGNGPVQMSQAGQGQMSYISNQSSQGYSKGQPVQGQQTQQPSSGQGFGSQQGNQLSGQQVPQTGQQIPRQPGLQLQHGTQPQISQTSSTFIGFGQQPQVQQSSSLPQGPQQMQAIPPGMPQQGGYVQQVQNMTTMANTMPQNKGGVQQQGQSMPTVAQSGQPPIGSSQQQGQTQVPQQRYQSPVPPPSNVQPSVSMTSQHHGYPTVQQQTNNQQIQRPLSGQSQMSQPLPQKVTPQPSYSSTVQQMNPLSPPDILPQPILPSPMKPVTEIQSSLHEVTMESKTPSIQDVTELETTSKMEFHTRARESPIVKRKQPEKSHSRSNSNTSQSEFKLPSRKHSCSSIGSSLDDILSSSPVDSTHEPPDSVLTPKVLTAQEIAQQKEDAILKGTLGRQFSKDPYPDSSKMDKFVAETEKLAKFVESLDKATCSGPSHLDIAWKEVIEDYDIHGKKNSMAIGRCYPMKNRDQDVLPYDVSRVLLTSHKDDYINASWINDLAESCPKFIATQAPLHSTMFDFWLIVYEQGSEVIVMLSSETENKDTKKFPEYWPPEKGKLTHHGPITLTLQSLKETQLWTERIIYLQHQQTKTGRTIVHLQYKNWPVSGFPEKVPSVLQFINEVHNFYRQQRSLQKPVMVHCSNGIGRTGTFLMIYTGMQEIDHGNGIINVQAVGKKMLQQRRYVIREKSQLKFCYGAILYHAQDILAKQGILVHKASFGDKLPHPGEKSYQWTPAEDVIFGACSINDLKSNVEKLGLHLGISNKHSSPKKTVIPKQELSSEEVDKQQKHFLPSKTEDHKMEGTLMSSLPDVVQRTDAARQSGDNDQKLTGSLSGSNASLLSVGSESEKITGSPIHKIRSRDGSPKPSSLHGSHEGSPKMQSLMDLQNPSSFTLGADGGKKKITKASFLDKTSGLSDNLDNDDPFSSIDPLWTMKK
ncbi:tyrosine-protein phosphatase non-receptor type 23-like [Mytilus trossulus]|uniref:tyrosine-protein phosphatase non-receptor type 23-like n=1 Tax=Mytilus trossulus TaxID=6551 RepID=UPI0030040ACC